MTTDYKSNLTISLEEEQLQSSPIPTELGKKSEYSVVYTPDNKKWDIEPATGNIDPYAMCPHCGKANWKRIIGKLLFCKFCHKHTPIGIK